MIRISKTVTAEVAHSIPNHPIESYRRVHGHSLVITATIEGERQDFGMICEFSMFEARLKTIVGMLDHRHLNEAHPEIDPPSLENIAEWLGRALSVLKQPGRLVAVKVERPTCGEAAEWLA